MNSLRVLVLVYKGMEPPISAPKKVIDWADWKTEYYVVKALKSLGHIVNVVGVESELDTIKNSIEQFGPDIVFNLLEEFDGEAIFDKNIVCYLELLGVPYTGANPEGLGLGRDKALTKKILNFHNIATPAFFVVPRGQKVETPDVVTFPVIVKSLVEEASLGISQKSVVHNENDLRDRVHFVHSHLDTDAMVEAYVPGRELYIGVLGNDKLQVFPPWELSFGSLSVPIATRRVKFNKAYCEKHKVFRGPAKGLPKQTLLEIQSLCKEAHRGLKLSGYSRMDLRLTSEGEVFFIEVNPNPELAKSEDFANAADLDGLKYEALIQQILELGLAWSPSGSKVA